MFGFNKKQIMSDAEIFDFGVEVVFNQMKKEGYEIQSVNTQVGQNPQIIAKKGEHLAFVAVRTACYPQKGKLEKNVHFQMIEHAKKHGAIPYFASVGICNADGKNEKQMGTPVKGAGFHIAYEGLLVITTSDRVKTM